jgi:hypothetical protein
MADKSGIRPKITHELAGKYVGGTSNLGYICRDLKNYLRTKRQNELKHGEAGGLLEYFKSKLAKNPSFQHVFQFDSEDQITNIFWADAKMIIDYAHFGDVVSFDTTFGTNRDTRPFGVFVGFNHFRETVVFGAVLPSCMMRHLNLLSGFLKPFYHVTTTRSLRPYSPIRILPWERLLQWYFQKVGMDYAPSTYCKMMSNI